VEQCFLEADALDLDGGLFSTGVLSSLDLIDLLAYLEEEFGIKIEPLETEMQNFDSVGLVLDFIAKKQASG
jgi:acyl carrier protein